VEDLAAFIAADPALVVQQAYGRAHGVPSSRVVVEAEMPEGKLDVAIWAPPGDDSQFRSFVEAGLGSALELEAREEDREVEALVLKATDDAQDKLSPTVSTGGSSTSSRQEEGRLIVTGINMQPAALAALIENILKRPVIDETSLSGGYDLEVGIPDTLETLQAELEKLGLTLEPEQRTLTYLVIESRGN
jgi:uncharacterized protein (TIGR03435 family)